MTKEECRNSIRDKILSEELLPGQWIVEREIVELYGLSRTPVREILRQLVGDGLLELRPSKGYVVKTLTFNDVVHIFHAREAVEGMAARLASRQPAQECRWETMLMLQQQLREINAEQQCAACVELGSRLHRLIVEMSDNPYLVECYEKLQNMANMTRNITKRSIAIEEKSRSAHLSLIDALLERDAQKSEQSMRSHLAETLESVILVFYEHARCR